MRMTTTNRRRMRARRRREGAVLTEAILVCASFVLMLGLLIFVHQLGLARIHAFQKARAEAWANSMAGCPSGDVGMREWMNGVTTGEVPMPNAFMPDTTATSAVHDTMLGLSRQLIDIDAEVSIPCRNEPPVADGNPTAFANELFGGDL